ncbi:hypothetical protein [Vibrio sp. 10N.239.312.D08]|uniref:hypothetical protein n=1 Tax=Vibrio sp. 10N.239.312.D08 TaxID=3229978 RepID=UPI00355087BB
MNKNRERQLEAALLQMVTETKNGGTPSVTTIRSAEILLSKTQDETIETAMFDNAISHLKHKKFLVSCLAEAYIHQFYSTELSKSQFTAKLIENNNVTMCDVNIEYADYGLAKVFRFENDQSVIVELGVKGKLIALHNLEELQENLKSPYIELLLNCKSSPFLSKSESIFS